MVWRCWHGRELFFFAVSLPLQSWHFATFETSTAVIAQIASDVYQTLGFGFHSVLPGFPLGSPIFYLDFPRFPG